ncbi:hypothetical protein [Streptomyces sp. NPDC058412]|uniref:hypothetical protein n=1 Tax=Streptomyces sp. NPDC058412 TaxID=3346486 RepID=UPI00364AD662
MSTWRDLLTEAGHWGEYRGALRALQKDEGPSFKDMAIRSEELATRDIPGVTSCSAGTLHKLTNSELYSAPKWGQVEVFVRACAEHDAERGREVDGEAVLRLWKDGFRRLKGEVPRPDRPDRPELPDRPERKGRLGLVVAAGVVVVLAAGAVAFNWPFSGGSGDDGKPDVPASSAPPTGTPTQNPTPTSSATPPVVKSERFPSRIAWSDNGGSTIVQVYSDYTDSAQGRGSLTGHAYDLGQDLVVQCQVAGRAVPLGDYRGPAQRNGLWYRMTTGEYIPAIYVDTGRDSLPTC